MMNPWKEIRLSDYENHMRLDSVQQLQMLSEIMKGQFKIFNDFAYMDHLGKNHRTNGVSKGSSNEVSNGSSQGTTNETSNGSAKGTSEGKVMILGIAGGNGLEHLVPRQYEKVYGVDINAEYLAAVRERYHNLDGMLECLEIDLINEYEKLPKADYVIANLLVEYIGYEAFQKVIQQVGPEAISCVIQINPKPSDLNGVVQKAESDWVSDSPYLHAFDGLNEVHHQMEEEGLWRSLNEIGYEFVDAFDYPLPNGKIFKQLEFGIIPKQYRRPGYGMKNEVDMDDVATAQEG